MTVSNDTGAASGALNLFRALPGSFAPRDAQDLMTYPFFSLAKSPRIQPIDYRQRDIAKVVGVSEQRVFQILKSCRRKVGESFS